MQKLAINVFTKTNSKNKMCVGGGGGRVDF